MVTMLGCGGGGGGPQAPALNPPSQVAAASSTYFGSFTVSWTEPSPAVDGYELEAKAGSADFQKVGTTKIPTGITSVGVTFTGNIAELTTVAFRLRSIRETAFSPYSNEAPSKFLLKAPSFFSSYYDSSLIGMRLTWDNDSTLATTVRVEKAVLTGSQLGTYSKIFEGPVSVLKTVDSALAEDTGYRYRISVQGQGESSLFVTTDSYPIPLLPPTGFTVSNTSTGAQLSWQGVSAKAVEIQVQRGNGISYPSFVTIASLPLGSTQYTDSGIASGFYSYRLVVKSASQTVYSTPVTLITQPTGTGLALSTTLRTMPSYIQAMTTWGDAPAFLALGTEPYSCVVTPPVGATWPSLTIFNVAVVSRSGFCTDAQGLPHVLFRRNVGTGYPPVQAVIHEWFNGTAWVSEELFRETFYDSSASDGIVFAVAPDGIIHAVWQPQANSGGAAWYGTNRTGTWESTQLQPDGGSSNLGSYRVALDSSSTAYVAIGLWNKVVLFSRAPGISSFTQEVVPTGAVNAGWYDALELRPFGSRVAIFYQRNDFTNGFMYLQMCLIKDQGQWGQPAQLAAQPNSSSSTTTQAAASVGSGRLVYAVAMPSGLQIFTLKANQTWDSVTLAPTGGYNNLIWIGFNNQDKFWCAVDGGSGPDYGTDIYAWYHE